MSLDAISIGILFATHWLGGVAAFGSTMLALPLLLWHGWDLSSVLALLLVGGTAQAIPMAWWTGRAADRRALVRIGCVAGAGLPVGFLAAGHLPGRLLQAGLGVVLLVAGASRLLERASRQDHTPPSWIMALLLFAGGVIHGAFASGGATLTVYARYALREKDAFRGTLSILWVVLNTVLVGALLAGGRIGHETLWQSLAAGPVILLATLLGNRTAIRLSQDRFADLVGVLLCIAGLVTLLRNLL